MQAQINAANRERDAANRRADDALREIAKLSEALKQQVIIRTRCNQHNH